ncbi:MAG: hypothetical protein GX028_09430 [Clostridiaceae bacterium]|nr:hypothetical protein [Clostridiaceae bacterium]
MTAKRKTSTQRGRTSQKASRRTSKTKSSGNNSRSQKKNSSGSPVLVLVYDFFAGTYFGRVSVAALLLCLIILINLLISGDRFNWFFVMTGIEIIIASAGGWLYFLLRDDGQ